MELISILCCPHCKGELTGNRDGYTCPACNRQYPATNPVLDFYPEYAGGKTRNQKIMESRRIVAVYETDKWRSSKFFEKGAQITLKEEISLIKKITSPESHDTVLDLSCGPGIYARAFAVDAPHRQIIGYDLSRPMLEWAVKRAREESLHNIRFIHGDAHYLPFKPASFHIVNCCGALHNYANVHKALDEITGILKPGGRLSLAVGLNTETVLFKLFTWVYDKYLKTHLFTRDELMGLLSARKLKPAIHHTGKGWMIASAVKQ